MPPKQQQRKGKAPLRRTVELPAALRQELQDLGHIPKPGKGKLGRKDKRKQAREEAKQRRGDHFSAGAKAETAKGGKGKRKAELQEEEEEEEGPAQQHQQSKNKRTKVDSAPAPSSSTETPAPKPHQTPLEKLLAKQEARSAPAAAATTSGRAKSGAELAEDQEIAWLEAKLGVRGGDPNDKKLVGGAWKGEMMDDGLDDLFGGLEDLEAAAFGSSNKEYARLLRQQEEGSDFSGSEDDDDDDLEAGLDALEYGGIDSGSEDDEDGAFGEDGVSDEELMDAGDDDDHREMGEVGSSGSEEEEEFDSGSEESGFEEDSEMGDEEEDEEQMMREFEEAYGGAEGDEEEEGGMEMTFGADGSILPSAASTSAPPPPAALSAPKKGAYVPPHLRQPPPSAPSTALTPATATNEPPIDPRLRRSMQGHLNKLSPLNISAILSAISSLYSSNPRAIVSATLTQLLLEMISGRDNLGEQLVVTYAALVAGLTRMVGIEFGAGVVAKAVGMFEESLATHVAAREEGKDEEDGGFEGRPGSKECLNLVAFIAELYNFGVVACVLVYDFVRLFVESGLRELETELLVKVVKRSGQQLRQDDPSALKEIINLVKAKQQGIDTSSMNSRTRFMVDSLTNLKNNKTSAAKADANGAVDHYSGLKKFLSGLRKGASVPEPLRLTLADLHSSSSKGKWWLVGAAWGGDPLVDQPELALKDLSSSTTTSDAKMAKLARAQGMNTDIRRGVFNVLMSSEDYVDACEGLLQLGLTDVQQREIARVLLQCCGNEKAYNPYYTLVAHRMATKSHGFGITLQYCLWDFLRELGEKKVGGEEMVKNLEEESGSGPSKVSKRRITNLAKLYAWCVAKEVLSLLILKPIPFGNPKPLTLNFLTQFFTYLLIATQTPSPALLLPTTATRKDKEAIERVFIKAAPHGPLLKGLGYFFETAMEDAEEKTDGERERKVVRFGIKVAKETLSSSSGIVVDLR